MWLGQGLRQQFASLGKSGEAPAIDPFLQSLIDRSEIFEAEPCVMGLISFLKDNGIYSKLNQIITPNGYGVGKLYSLKGADVDWVRPVTADRIDQNGNPQTMDVDVPRLDYANGSCPEILVGNDDVATIDVSGIDELFLRRESVYQVYDVSNQNKFTLPSGRYEFACEFDNLTQQEKELLIGGRRDIGDDFVIEVNTELSGVSNSDQFEFTGAVGEYDVEAYQNGDLVATFENLVNEQTITLPSAGIYELRCKIKPAGFNKMRFNNSGDRLKLLKILNWGLYGVNEPDQIRAFWGCQNNTEIAGNGDWFDVVTIAFDMFRDNPLTSLPSDMTLPLLSNGNRMFFNNSLTSLPSVMSLPLLEGGERMFQNNSLTSLPVGMDLPLLTQASQMFISNNLTSLPSGMNLPLLTNGSNMFFSNTINTERYSQLLIDLEANNNNNNVEFHGGNSKYNAQGEIARNALIARGWTFTDGGLEN